MPNFFQLASTRSSEVRLSPDGAKIYAADKDGFVRVYAASTGELITAWQVGQKLGGMDISPDGSFLAVVERNLSTTYRVDTATGAKTAYNYATSSFEGLIFDVAILSDGTALFSQDFPGSGGVTLKILNYTTGVYQTGQGVSQSSVFSRSPTGDFVLIGEPNSSAGPIDIYKTGTGIIARSGAAGYNWGIQAFSGSLAAQYIYNEGIHVYDIGLHRQITLTTWNNGAVTDLAFSADSKWLYVLENRTNTIVKVSTADWTIDKSISVGSEVGSWLGQVGATNGARLILEPGERFFSVVTDTKLLLVANPDAPRIDGTSSADTLYGALFDDRITGFAGNDSLMGGAGNDQLDGGAGNDTIYGGLGDDTIDGGLGVDSLNDSDGANVFYVDNLNDRVFGNQQSTVVTSVSWTAGNFAIGEIRAVAGTSAINITGNIGLQRIVGNDGDNVLNGLTFPTALGQPVLQGDTLIGLGGNDTYGVQNAFTIVTEAVGGGSDVVFAEVDYTLNAGSEIEVLSAADQTGTQAFKFTGNEFAQTIIGNFGANALRGGGGADTLTGLGGNDVYTIDSTATVVRETAGGGSDTLIVTAATGSYLLNAGAVVELLRAEAGSAAINIGGNEQSQRIEGNDGNNILSSGGGGGVDTMAGGLGDDTYRVFATGDVIDDTGGFDTLYVSGTSYFLYSTAAVEYLSSSLQAGTEPIYLVGNGASQVIAGNYGDNILNGRGGDGQGLPDTLIGLFGNDIYAVFGQGDVVRETAGQGQDIVYANTSYQLRNGTEVEALAAVDGGAADAASAYTLRGNEFAQTIVGNNAANVLDGRGGNDALIGLGGADVFAFTAALGTGNVDTIQDFGSGDRIGLATDIFAAVTPDGISAGELVIGTAAQDADDRLIYDQTTGRLFYDADGNGTGAAALFAQLTPGAILSAASFVAVNPVSDLPAI